MLKNNSWLKDNIFLFLRLSLGFVFLKFGVGKFHNDIWVKTIKSMDFFMKLPWNVDISVFLIGISEIATGGGLVIGLGTRFFAAFAACELLGILVLLNFGEVRDIGLLGMAIFMALAKDHSFGVDWFINKKK